MPLVGPVEVGKSFLAQALGYAAVRAGHTVRFAPADRYFREMAQACIDRSKARPVIALKLGHLGAKSQPVIGASRRRLGERDARSDGYLCAAA
ncbi:MAG: ATP-binding protein [Chloroflexota bacterium]|nr:ATP-binding protein [Chloroflexota bacterium]